MMKALYVICLTAILGLGACSKKAAGPEPTPVVDGRVEILVKDMGFEPTLVVAPAGKPVTLAFKRISDSPCAVAVMIKQFNIKKDLTLNKINIHLLVKYSKSELYQWDYFLDLIQ